MPETADTARGRPPLRRRGPRGSAADKPIVPGFYPDPTICRVGSDYYLAHSSFEYFPGAPIFHSRDLLTWSQIGNILGRRTQFRLGDARPSAGIYGSTLRYHAGRFWFVTTNVSDFESGQVIVHAKDPAGPWSEPIFVPDALGIDPDLCWDENGQCYLTWNALSFSSGKQEIRQARADLKTGALCEPYLGGRAAGWPRPRALTCTTYGITGISCWPRVGRNEVTASRRPAAARPGGRSNPVRRTPVFTHRSTVHPVQNVAHADLVQTIGGKWAAVYLGVRPRGSTPGFHVLGRETFLAGLDWVDGWPAFDEARFDAPSAATGFAEDFSAAPLDPRWVVPGGEPENVAVRHPGGGLALRCLPGGSPGLLCARVRDLAWTARAAVTGSGRFLLRLDDRYWYGLTFKEGQVRAIARIGDVPHELGSAAVASSTMVLRIESVQPSSAPAPLGHAGPDDVVLSFDDGDGFRELGRLDGRYLSTEVGSGFTGRMLALGSTAGQARVMSVEYDARRNAEGEQPD